EITLDEHREPGLPDLRFRQIEPVERAALGIYRRFGRIQVLGPALSRIHLPPAEGDHRPGVAADRNHQAVAEAIDHFARVPLDDEAAVEEQRLAESLPE